MRKMLDNAISVRVLKIIDFFQTLSNEMWNIEIVKNLDNLWIKLFEQMLWTDFNSMLK